MQRLFKSGVIQAKRKISEPNDLYEQEADPVGRSIMGMPDPVSAEPDLILCKGPLRGKKRL